MNTLSKPTVDLYQHDFHAWLQEQTALLRAGRLAEIDLVHLLEELDAMGVGQRNELKNRIRVLLQHLLKWESQPAHRSSGWMGTIIEQRNRLELLLDSSPSLRPLLPETLAYAYPRARQAACRETALEVAVLPIECPYSAEQILHSEFRPGQA